MLLGVELIIHLAPLGLPQALDDDLLAVACCDAAELHRVHRDVHDVAHLVLGGEPLGLLNGHLVGGVHVVLFLHHVFLDEHLQVLVCLVHTHDDVLHILDNLLHHEGLGDAPLLLQQSQCREAFRGIEAYGLLLLFAFHVADSPC